MTPIQIAHLVPLGGSLVELFEPLEGVAVSDKGELLVGWGERRAWRAPMSIEAWCWVAGMATGAAHVLAEGLGNAAEAEVAATGLHVHPVAGNA